MNDRDYRHEPAPGWQYYEGGSYLPPPSPPDRGRGPALSPGPTGPPPPRRGRRAAAIGALVAVVVAVVAVRVGSAVQPMRTLPSSAPTAEVSPFDPFGGGNQSAAPPVGGSGLSSSEVSTVVARVEPAVVNINTRLGYQNAAAAGTGMVLSASGTVLTNNHVIDGATSIRATVVGTGRTYNATVVGTAPSEDVAVIQLQGASGLPTIPTGDSSSVSEGDPVVAMGNAGGRGGEPTVVTGTVQALGRSIVAGDENGANPERLTGLIQTDAPIEPGDSGGPLADASGKVIGMDTAAATGNRSQSSASIGFAIPITTAVSVARQIESGQASSTVHIGARGFLGVQVSSTGTGQGGLGGSTSGTSGPTVMGVEPGSPAATAGLAQGDTITSVNGRGVDSAEALTAALGGHHPGDRVTAGWTDASGVPRSARVSLAAGPAG